MTTSSESLLQRVSSTVLRLTLSAVVSAILAVAFLVALAPPSEGDDEKHALERGPVVSIDREGAATLELVAAEGTGDLSVAASWKQDGARSEALKLEKAEDGKLRATLPKAIPGSTLVDYEVKSGGAVVAKSQLRTLPEKGSKKLTFCALGDSGYPRRGKNVATEDQLLVAKLLAKLDPDLVVHVGDVVYQVGQEKGLDPLFFQPYQETLARVPFFCCLGNHDVKTKDGDPELRAFPHPPNEHGNRYFSFDAANVHFVCADSNDVFEIKAPKDFPETPQGKWLKSDLAAATSATWKIAYFHHPLYSCFATRVQERATIRAAFETLLEDAGVDLVICGHDHFYHRSFRMLDGKKDDEGIVHVVTGGGGATLYPGKAVEGTTACYNACYHLTRFVVDGASLEIEALAPRESGEPESIDKTKITSRKMR